MENHTNLSIIGLGNFGKLVAKNLSKKFNVVVTDIIDKSIYAEEVGLRFVALEEALNNKIIRIMSPRHAFGYRRMRCMN